MKRKSLYLIKPHQVEIKSEEIDPPDSNKVLVKTDFSSISAGTEMLLYRKQIEKNLPLDTKIADLSKNFQYPLKYGYSSVGKVISLGENVDSSWKNKFVFSFHPHESYFTTTPDKLFPIPKKITKKEATFLPSVETAINLIMDGNPIIGEYVAVIGQGVIGLITTNLLSKFPLSEIVTVEPHSLRREFSKRFGADISLDPDESRNLIEKTNFPEPGADLTYEVSGNPETLDLAIELTRFDGRIIVGSWYGKKKNSLNLGSKFHRNRISILSSQVSTINPKFLGRWDHSRRISLSWEIINELDLSELITHEIPIEKAAEAYELIDQEQEKVLQIILTYEN